MRGKREIVGAAYASSKTTGRSPRFAVGHIHTMQEVVQRVVSSRDIR